MFVTCCGLAWGVRLWVLYQMSSVVLGCGVCVVPNVIAADALFWAGTVALFVLSLKLKSRLLYAALRAVSIVALSLYLIDIVIMSQFNTRLMWADVSIYAADAGVALGVLEQWPLTQLLVGVGATVLGGWLIATPIKRTVSWLACLRWWGGISPSRRRATLCNANV